MTRAVTAGMLTAFLLVGCGKSGSVTSDTLTTGMPFRDAQCVLERNGLREVDEHWEMECPDGMKTHTFYLDKANALLLSEDVSNGSVQSMVIYRNVDRPKSEREFHDVRTFNAKTKS